MSKILDENLALKRELLEKSDIVPKKEFKTVLERNDALEKQLQNTKAKEDFDKLLEKNEGLERRVKNLENGLRSKAKKIGELQRKVDSLTEQLNKGLGVLVDEGAFDEEVNHRKFMLLIIKFIYIE